MEAGGKGKRLKGEGGEWPLTGPQRLSGCLGDVLPQIMALRLRDLGDFGFEGGVGYLGGDFGCEVGELHH